MRAGGGLRIFPDRASETDTTRHDMVDVVVTVSPAPPAGTLVYLKAFDVDDPSADPTFVLDPDDRDPTTGVLSPVGYDNFGDKDSKGIAIGKRGAFASSGNETAVATVDANGKARASFIVTMQPGDNFRVAASLVPAALNPLTDERLIWPTKIVSVPFGQQQLSSISFGGQLTSTLTVWRRLWIERDKMAPVPTPNPMVINANITAVTVSPASPGGADLIVQLDKDLDREEDGFEGGTITIPRFGNKVLTIYNSSNSWGADTVTVPANSFTAAELAAINAGRVPAIVADDDDVSGLPALPDGGPLLQSAYGAAYILPQIVDMLHPEWDSPNDTVPFFEYMYDDSKLFSHLGAMEGARNLHSNTGFWTTLVVGVYQNKPETDADPDGRSSKRFGIVQDDSKTGPGLDYGVTPYQNKIANLSVIYMETIRDARCIG